MEETGHSTRMENGPEDQRPQLCVNFTRGEERETRGPVPRRRHVRRTGFETLENDRTVQKAAE